MAGDLKQQYPVLSALASQGRGGEGTQHGLWQQAGTKGYDQERLSNIRWAESWPEPADPRAPSSSCEDSVPCS